ncbi:uncharacterized protein ACA1_199790 [Acanthamoeba castellanii str. Neff]|uniref:RFX DNAbinding domain containing protein n=1 Tax=Acanthamoeba castellanii (strain ATCC 30010 / Neff) TaxID=1257118 RepID=L8H3B6_ACACF|nr:uncharacterized protein ACA1_199790 [Acanthamoeba castellanii str. Neff]ELR19695.1 hypothetical protein ACA1_199790 [Acanthamoeba castellanii str. Neff]
MQLHSSTPPTYNQFEHSNKLTGREPTSSSATPSSPQLSPPAGASPSSTSQGQVRAAKAVTPATVIAWLREHYKLGKHGYSKKAAALCAERGADSSISSTFFGKLVKRAFPEIKTIRKGPRGKVEQCYDRLKPVDPAKASRARWLERVNLYLAALQASGAPQQPPPASHPAAAARAQPDHPHHHHHPKQQQPRLLPPRASPPLHQSHYYAAVEGGAGVGQPDHHHHHHYASSLDGGGGHYLASLLPSFDSPSPSSSFASSPAPSSPSTELAQTTPHDHDHHHQDPHDYAQQQQQQQQPPYRGYASFESVQPAGAYGVAARQDNTSWPQPPQQPGLSAYMPAATMGHHHRHHHRQVAAGPYTTLLAQEPSPLYADHHLDHASFALYL